MEVREPSALRRLVVCLMTLYGPFVPILNRVPRWVGVYKLRMQ